ncbi:MAG: adenylate/guanylate cyclase domain-containing protein [Deltaproteobacteria bacterium]|nr:adenylate/guanylate cyclase domain-containing protein [Deltaproteobacteria bacterium]
MKRIAFALALLTLCCAAVHATAHLDRHAPAGGSPPWQRALLGISNAATDARFALHGPRPAPADIAVVAIDSEALARYGRWPWHRDVLAALVDGIGSAGARSIGLDMVFSEADPRATDGLRKALTERGLGALADEHETDPLLAGALAKHADKVALGWQTDSPCIPLRDGPSGCPADEDQFARTVPPSLGLFALPKPKGSAIVVARSPLVHAVTVVANQDLFGEQARRAGFFNAFLDPDGVVRTSYVVMAVAGRLHPALGLAMAQVAWGGKVRPAVADDGRLLALGRPDGAALPVDESGQLRLNFYGPGRSFRYVSASAILAGEAAALASVRGAHVLVGLTALGAHDMRAFPFDANVPGVEGHATLLGNLLDGSAFAARDRVRDAWWLSLVVLSAGLLVALALQRLDAVRGLIAAAVGLGGLGAADVWLFARGVWFDSGAVHLGLWLTVATLVGVRYFQEQRSRAFIKSAFSRYVSPALVDRMVADPAGLRLGGEKKDLTILFSDIRSFTTVSERLDPRELVAFLNHYLGRMTEIVFDHKGTLDKYIGDAVMAFWGAPLDDPNHPRGALDAAVAMIAAVDALRPGVQARWDLALHIGIGVATGVVSVGNMGSERNLAYTALGDRVNLAARLESLTKTYGAAILTTADTLQAAQAGGGRYHARTVDFVRVKGKKEPVELVELRAEPFDPAELTEWTTARAHYLGERFAEARSGFAQLATDHPHALYTLMADRCQHWIDHPPGHNWSGAWTMESK